MKKGQTIVECIENHLDINRLIVIPVGTKAEIIKKTTKQKYRGEERFFMTLRSLGPASCEFKDPPRYWKVIEDPIKNTKEKYSGKNV